MVQWMKLRPREVVEEVHQPFVDNMAVPDPDMKPVSEYVLIPVLY